MEGAELNKALEHDQAAKVTQLPGIPPEMMQTPVSIVSIGRQLDEKIAVLAKTVSLSMLDVARACTMLAMQPIDQTVTTNEKGEQMVEGKPPRPEVSEKWMGIATVAVDLAHKADVLGDRPLARRPPEPAKE